MGIALRGRRKMRFNSTHTQQFVAQLSATQGVHSEIPRGRRGARRMAAGRRDEMAKVKGREGLDRDTETALGQGSQRDDGRREARRIVVGGSPAPRPSSVLLHTAPKRRASSACPLSLALLFCVSDRRRTVFDASRPRRRGPPPHTLLVSPLGPCVLAVCLCIFCYLPPPSRTHTTNTTMPFSIFSHMRYLPVPDPRL